MLVGKTWDGAVQRWLADNSEKRSLKSDQSNILWLNKFLSDVRLDLFIAFRVAAYRAAAPAISPASFGLLLAIVDRKVAFFRSFSQITDSGSFSSSSNRPADRHAIVGPSVNLLKNLSAVRSHFARSSFAELNAFRALRLVGSLEFAMRS